MSTNETETAKTPAEARDLGDVLVTKTVGSTGRWSTEDIDQPWSIGEAIGVAMRAVRRHFFSIAGPLVVLQIIGGIVAAAPIFALGRMYGFAALADSLKAVLEPSRSASSLTSLPIVPRPQLFGMLGAGAIAAFIVGAVGLSWLMEATLAAVRDETALPGRLGRALRRTPRIFSWLILFVLVVGLPAVIIEGLPIVIAHVREAADQGLDVALAHAAETADQAPWYVHLATFIVSGFLPAAFVLAYGWAPFLIVDDDAPLLTAMRRSWRAGKEYLGTTFLYLIALAPISLLATVPIFGVIAQAFVWLGLAYGYVRATGRNDLPWYPAEFASRSIRTFLRVTLVVLALVAIFLVVWVKGIPTTHGSAWSVQDTAMRVAAILASVAVVVVLLALLLPYGLDRLEGRRFTSFVAARHVRSQKSGFLTVISVLSICGVAMSSCALSSVVSVMGGFSQDLKRKILGNNAHIVVDTTAATPWGDYESTLAAIRKVPGVVGATPVVHGEVMASSASNLAGVVVTGIDPTSINDVIELNHNIEVGSLDYLEHSEKLTKLPANEVIGIGPGGEPYYKGAELPALDADIDPEVRAVIKKPDRPGIVLGRELAKTLHVYVGDDVTLVSPLGDLGPMGIMPRTKRFRVAAIFYSGMYEYDAMSVYTMLDQAEEYFATGEKISAIDIKVDDAEGADRIAPAVVSAVSRPELRIRDWREINKNLFSALKLERFATFIILSIAIIVASFCIVCTLLLMVTEKGKEIAILKAIGASDGAILGTFMIEGMIIGGIGTVFGVVTGLAMCTGLSWFGLRLDPEVYYIDRLPISVSGWDFLTVAASALIICTLSTLYPAYAASRLRPVDGLRYE